MTGMAGRNGFLAASLQGLLPLLVWAAHFAFSYVFVALACMAPLGRGTLSAVLLAATAAALIALAWMGVGAARLLARDPGATGPAVRLGGAVLALIAVAWTALPMVSLAACGAWGQG
jgi:hypothetical protein